MTKHEKELNNTEQKGNSLFMFTLDKLGKRRKQCLAQRQIPQITVM